MLKIKFNRTYVRIAFHKMLMDNGIEMSHQCSDRFHCGGMGLVCRDLELRMYLTLASVLKS